jgi:hypothetical protein
VKVCDRWLNSFEAFLADMGERLEGTTLGRFMDTGNYEPENCTWQTRKEQAVEQRAKRRIVARKPIEFKTSHQERAAISRKNAHLQWHTRRNIVNVECLYCVPVVESQVA